MQPFADRELRALICLLLVAVVGCTLWLVRRFHPTLFLPPPDLVVESQAESSPTVTVHVVGAVQRPGIYTLPRGSRIRDALQAAGGPTQEADLDLLNQAAVLRDGRQVRVPARREIPAPTDPPSKAAPIPLNRATAAQLEQIPGIGPVMARRILDYRETHGGFSSMEELLNVRGIGPKTLERIREYLVVY